MFKDFGIYWGYRYSTIVIHIAVIAVTILDERNDRTETKLARHIRMPQHTVEKMLKHIEEIQ